MSPRLDSIACVELSSNHRRTHAEKKYDALSAHEATNQQGLTETKLVSRANQNKYGKASNIVDMTVGTKSANQCCLL